MELEKVNNGAPKLDFSFTIRLNIRQLYHRLREVLTKQHKMKILSLREKQNLFALNIAKLILWAYEKGYEITLGEALRTEDQQMLYFEGYSIMKIGSDVKLRKVKPASKTMKSDHLLKLALDINLFVDGKYTTDGESFKPLHEYWKSLHPDNYSGYDWGWDYNHFGTKP